MGISTFANVVAQEQSVYRGKQLILWTVPTRFMFRLCISAWVYLDLRYGWVLFSDRRALDALLEVISQVSSTPKGTRVVQPWLPGEASQTRARRNKPAICFKNSVLIQNQTRRKVLLPTKLTLTPPQCPGVTGELPTWMLAAPSSAFFPGPFWREQSPTGPKQPKGGRRFAPLIAPSRRVRSLTQPHVPPMVHWTILGTIFWAQGGWVNQAGTKLLLPSMWPPD